MTTDENDLLDKLSSLQEVSLKRKFNLSNPEKDEAVSLLSSLCRADNDGFLAVMDALPKIPSDVGADAIAICWDELIERGEPIYSKLQEDGFSSDLGKRLRLVLARKLLTKDPQGALRILINVCQIMRSAKRPIPTVKDLRLIYMGFLAQGVKVLPNLPLNEGKSDEISLLLNALLSAAFVAQSKGRPIATTETQLAIIRWANSYPKLPIIVNDVKKMIPKRIKEWSTTHQRLLKAELDALQPEISELVKIAFAVDKDQEMKAPACIPGTSSTGEGTTSRPSVAVDIEEYNAPYEIERLTNYLSHLESLLKKAQADLASARMDLANTRSELGDARGEIEESRLQIKNLQDEKSTIEEALNEARMALNEKEVHHEGTIKSYEQQLNASSERIVKEREIHLNTFRKKLASELRSIIKNLKDAEEMEMTPELGKVMRAQLRQIIWLLKKEGIDLSEGN